MDVEDFFHRELIEFCEFFRGKILPMPVTYLEEHEGHEDWAVLVFTKGLEGQEGRERVRYRVANSAFRW